jgi:hypothetical protein
VRVVLVPRNREPQAVRGKGIAETDDGRDVHDDEEQQGLDDVELKERIQ